MKIADILRTIAANLEHAQGGAPDPRIQNPGQMLDVSAATEGDKVSPNGTTPAGNAKQPEDLFVPPLQQKQELLKKAVGVENVYDDGGPEHQHANEQELESLQAEHEKILSRIKQLSGVPTAAIQELANDDIVDD